VERRVLVGELLERELLVHGVVVLMFGRLRTLRTWSGPPRLLALIAVLTVAATVGLAPPSEASLSGRAKVDPELLGEALARPAASLDVIVRESLPTSDAAERLVGSLGGRVTHELPLVDGFSAAVPANRLDVLARSDTVIRVWGDAPVRSESVSMGSYDTWPANTVWRHGVRVPQAQASGKPPWTGAGVTVAVLDTGISNLADLGNRVLARVDLTPEHDGYDRYGHGTHMAGIIASNSATYPGVAPGANLVSVKVAGANGATDVSVVIAGLEWIVAHKTQYNIRIVNLSFGTDSRQPYSVDPLDFAVERTWFSGIFVVVSAGNAGSSAGTISKPGDDPYVLTVGAADLKNTLAAGDDVVAPFSSVGPTQDGFAKPDIVAPGVTIVSDLAPNSTVATAHPAAIVSGTYIKGTGTSQAAAVVSGAAALVLQAAPTFDPNRLKAVLLDTASKMGLSGSGTGLIDVASAVKAVMANKAIAPANAGFTPSTGLGSLEASRGSLHVYADPTGTGTWVAITGEKDVVGQLWDARSWSVRSWSSDAWLSSGWADLTATTAGWGTTAWSGRSWSGTSWDARSWSSSSFTARSWSEAGWS
jgi:serine protease AprX